MVMGVNRKMKACESPAKKCMPVSYCFPDTVIGRRLARRSRALFCLMSQWCLAVCVV